MTLAERYRELSSLDALFKECATGTVRVAIVGGPVASGKTALLHALAERAVEAGALVLSAAASRAEQTLPLGVLDQLLRNVESADGDVDRELSPLDHALTRALSSPDLDVTTHLASPSVRDLLGRLHQLAEDRPVLIAVDDVEYADDLSLRCLLYLVRRLRSDRVMVVFTELFGPRRRHPILETDVMRQPYCRYIRLEPLSPFAVGTLLTQRTSRPGAQRLVGAFHRITGGNPLLVKALLEDSLDPARGMSAPAPGEAFQEAVVRCLYRYESPELDVARAIAILGDAASPDLLAATLGLSRHPVAEATETLTLAGLLDGTRFRDGAARVAVLQSIPPGDRMALHASAATALHNAGFPASAVAEHLLCGVGPREPWEVAVLRETAEQALDNGDGERALLLLKRAQRHSADERERAVALSLIARAEWLLDPSSVERLLPELGTAVRRGLLTGRHGARAIDYLLWHGRPQDAAELLGELRHHDERTAGQALNRLRALYPDTRPPAWGEAAPGRAALAPQLSAVHTLSDDVDVLMTGAEQVLQSARLDDSALIPVIAALAALIYGGSLDKAEFWRESLAAEAGVRRTPVWEAMLAGLGAMTELRRGDLRAAHRQASRALTVMPARSWGVGIGLPLASMVAATVGLGNLDRAEAWLDTSVPEAMFQTRAGLHYLEARGWFHMSTGRLHAALGDFQVCGELMGRWGLDIPAVVPWRSSAAYAYAELGRRDEGRALAEEQLAVIPSWDHRTRGITLRALARTSDMRGRRALLFEAVEVLQRSYDRLELARALTDLSRVQHGLGEPGTARRTARRADRLAEASGAQWRGRPPFALAPAARAATEGRAVAEGRAEAGSGAGSRGGPEGVPAAVAGPGVDDLSNAELRVAALAADGYTNRQIAAKLFITVSTVEQHLTRVYRKLRLSRRSDLPSAIPPEASLALSERYGS
ncbi:AAA family ATPase [Actinomadura sp. NEAU-AAG7]|uniref:helix-turn-helix transcriptional regulator n=1 Tax=Actinomadura sp. NEAU-AAG7 TaxID=2839640 RepID=UPI0027DFA533|nr:AAA family ATPase [Actinomadura sp. NEAU-AAG7]